eukprot:SAG11_NODE_987_length_6278_cov_10.303447_3_plen_40_part_00
MCENKDTALKFARALPRVLLLKSDPALASTLAFDTLVSA